MRPANPAAHARSGASTRGGRYKQCRELDEELSPDLHRQDLSNLCVLADRVGRLNGLPGVAGIASVYAEPLFLIQDLEGFLAETEDLQLLSWLLSHGGTVVAFHIEVKVF
jgi:hypothetical protein